MLKKLHYFCLKIIIFAFFLHISIKSSTFAVENDNKHNMKVAKVIRKYGYTTDDVANMIGMHSASLRKSICNKGGNPANPTLSTLRNIADAIGCSVGEFFDDERETVAKGWDGTQPKLNIRRVMDLQGVGRNELATRLGLTPQRVSELIRKQNLSLASVYNIASALNVPITDLFEYE
jgi:transcriptional regulator with XRE-family HTH domain